MSEWVQGTGDLSYAEQWSDLLGPVRWFRYWFGQDGYKYLYLVEGDPEGYTDVRDDEMDWKPANEWSGDSWPLSAELWSDELLREPVADAPPTAEVRTRSWPETSWRTLISATSPACRASSTTASNHARQLPRLARWSNKSANGATPSRRGSWSARRRSLPWRRGPSRRDSRCVAMRSNLFSPAAFSAWSRGSPAT